MLLERLLQIWISFLRRASYLKSSIQLTLLRVLSKLQHIVNLGCRKLPFSNRHGSFSCASQQPSSRSEADEQKHSLEISESHLAGPSIRPSELLHPSPPQVLGPTLTDPQDHTSVIGSVRASIPGRRPHLCAEVPNLLAIAPTEYQRYDRNEMMKKVYTSTFVIQPLTTSFSSPDLPSDWHAIKHPEGALYFYHSSKHILTDTYLHDEKRRLMLDRYIDQILSYITRYGISLGKNTVLVLDLRTSGKIGYYFVDHEKQAIFWLDPFCFLELDELQVEYTGSHVGLQILTQYWYHNNLFPDCFTISPDIADTISQLKDLLTFAIGDVLTSDNSIVPHSSDDLLRMFDLLDKMGDLKEDDKYRAGAVFTLSRLLVSFMDLQVNNFHGERAARTNSGQSIFPSKDPAWIIRFLSPIFFFAPQGYLKKLNTAAMDNLVNCRAWKGVLSQLTEEWKDLTLVATVLLASNVSFLAIRSVDATQTILVHQASYVSILSSLGSIILGLLLTRLHRTASATEFLARRGVARLAIGFEMLALIYSLPYTLLLWGLIFFLVSFSSMCYTTNNVSTFILISFALMCPMIPAVWCISASFEGQPFYPGHLLPIRVWYAIQNKFQELMCTRSHIDADRVTSSHPL